MEGLTTLLQSFSELVAPVFNFAIWSFPIKIYRLHDGERGVITTFGKVRSFRNAERGPGMTLCYAFEEMHVIQAIGGYIDLTEQNIKTADNKIVKVNGAIEYSVFNVKEAILDTEDLEDLIEGVCMNEIREYARIRDLNELANSEKLTTGLATIINRRIKKHGTKVERVMITDLRPHEVMMACDTVNDAISRLEKIMLDKQK